MSEMGKREQQMREYRSKLVNEVIALVTKSGTPGPEDGTHVNYDERIETLGARIRLLNAQIDAEMEARDLFETNRYAPIAAHA
jgi:hypothetical protein